jgi:ParB-like chromosome segregation protein Spo0J
MLKVQNIELSLLMPWEDNPRINDEAVNAVVESITSFGFNVPILCDPQFTIIAGHTRWKAAKKIGMKSVPVIILDITDVQREAFALADNKTAEIAKWDYTKLRKVLEKLKRRNIRLPSLAYSQAELRVLLAKRKEFNWKKFEERLKTNLAPTLALLPVKVRTEMKEVLKRAIQRCADEHDIKNKDFAITAGQVFGLLLESKNEENVNSKS